MFCKTKIICKNMGNVPEGDIGLVEQAGSSNVVQQQQVNQRIQLV